MNSILRTKKNLIFLGLFLILITAGISYIAYKISYDNTYNQKYTFYSSPQQKSTSQRVAEQPKIKTYTDREIGFTFSYPGEYYIKDNYSTHDTSGAYKPSEQTSKLNAGITWHSIDDPYIDVSVTLLSKVPDTRDCEIETGRCNLNKNDLKLQAESRANINIGDVEYYGYSADNTPFGYKRVIYKDSHNGVITLIFSSQWGGWDLEYSVFDKNLNKILVQTSITSIPGDRNVIPVSAVEVEVMKKIADSFRFIK